MLLQSSLRKKEKDLKIACNNKFKIFFNNINIVQCRFSIMIFIAKSINL